MRIKRTLLSGTVVASLLFSGYMLGCWTGIKHAQAAPAPPPAIHVSASAPASAGLPAFADLAERVSPVVVYIKVVSVQKTLQQGAGLPDDLFGKNGPFHGFLQPFPAPPPGGYKQQGSGTGFIVRKDGLIVTNNHVVENAKDITVTLNDGREFKATLVGRDPKTDLAVLKISAKGPLAVAKLGDSDALRVGDWVMAIGNPFGLSNTVTAGIVSAKGRVIGAGPYDDFIQTDASINPGNSGGPLFNQHGEAVGINSAIFSRSGGNIGIGFAIPINLAKQLLPQLEEHGSVTRGWLGVSIQKLTPELAKSLDVDAHGALVADVSADGPADHGGLERGDVIVRYDGKDVPEASTLPALVAATPVGNTVPVEVVRHGHEKTFEVKIGKLENEAVAGESEGTPHQSKWGLALRDLRPEERQRMGLTADEGVLVAQVMPGSPADDAGVQPGDVVLQVNRTPVRSVEQLKKEADKVTGNTPLLLLLHRGQGDNRFAALAPK